jgi:hypothetical protein
MTLVLLNYGYANYVRLVIETYFQRCISTALSCHNGCSVCEISYDVKLVQGAYLSREVEMAVFLQAHLPSILASKKNTCAMILVLHSSWNKLHQEIALWLDLQIITWILIGNY